MQESPGVGQRQGKCTRRMNLSYEGQQTGLCYSDSKSQHLSACMEESKIASGFAQNSFPGKLAPLERCPGSRELWKCGGEALS